LKRKNSTLIEDTSEPVNVISNLIETGIITQGMCFGHENLIEKKSRRNVSIYCLEDSDILFLNNNDFDLSFGKIILKSAQERKEFLKHKIKTFSINQIHENYFTSIYNLFKTIVIIID